MSQLRKEVACPKCGCMDVSIARQQKLFDDDIQAIYKCNHCHKQFFEDLQIDAPDMDLVAIYQTTVCPYCKSKNTVITRGPQGKSRQRYHQCRESGCGMPFSSREI